MTSRFGDRRLLPIHIFVLLVLTAPLTISRGAINVFNLDLVRLWQIETLTVSQVSCKATNRIDVLHRMSKWLEIADKSGFAYDIHHGQLACLWGDSELAKTIWERDKDYPISNLFAAIVSFYQGHLTKTSFPDQLGALGYNRGILSQEASDIPMAIKWYSFSLAYAPSIVTTSKLAGLYLAQGQDMSAKETWQQLVDMFPASSPFHWEGLARLAQLENDWSTAVEAYRREIEVADSKDLYRLWLALGNAHVRERKYIESEYAFMQAIGLEPNSIHAYLGVGDTFRYRGEYDKASIWYQKSQDIDPTSNTPPFYLGLVNWERGRYQDAFTLFQQSLAKQPNNPQVLYYQALALDALEQRADAIDILALAITFSAQPPESWLTILEQWRVEAK